MVATVKPEHQGSSRWEQNPNGGGPCVRACVHVCVVGMGVWCANGCGVRSWERRDESSAASCTHCWAF